MIEFLAENPLFLLFLVIAIGYPFGRINVGGVRFGVATTLFAGLAIGAIDDRLKLPEIIYELGLVVFVYTIGISSGRGFVQSLRRRGTSVAIWTLGLVSLGVGVATLLFRSFDFKATEAAGLLTGSMTNTPALAGILDNLNERYSGPTLDRMLTEPVVAYSITYPMAVLGTIAAIIGFNAFWRIDYEAESLHAGTAGFLSSSTRLVSRTAVVTRHEVEGRSVEDLSESLAPGVVFGRLLRGTELSLIVGTTVLRAGDLVTMIGEETAVMTAIAALGEERQERLDLSREEIDYRRIFVSNPALSGQRLRDLNLPQNFGAIVTRVRRGDREFVPTGDTVLEPGDRVRVVTRRDHMDAVTRFFGDSYRALSEFDILTFSVGIAVGLAIGAIPIPLPGGIELKLGIAGGPLVVALVLGALERTGRLAWTISYSANLTLRQFGLILFLAGIGTRSGFAFREVIGTGHGVQLFLAGVILTAAITTTALWTARRLLHLPMGIVIGMLAGLQTQPAVLSFAQEQSDDELPDQGYSMVFPLAMIAKIVAAQVMLALLL